MESIAEIATTALQILEEKGWGQGPHTQEHRPSLSRENGPVCITMALDMALRGMKLRGMNQERSCRFKALATATAMRFIDVLGLELLSVSAGGLELSPDWREWNTLIHWNDEPSRSVEDVVLALKKVANSDQA